MTVFIAGCCLSSNVFANVQITSERIYKYSLEVLCVQFKTTAAKQVTGIFWFPRAYKSYVQGIPWLSSGQEMLPLLLLLLSHFSRVQLCATPQMAAHRALLSLGFSRQEHSGSPIQSLFEELRSCKLHGAAKKKETKNVTV